MAFRLGRKRKGGGVEGPFQLIVEAAPNAMIMVYREGKITMVNAQTETLFCYKRNELLGQKIEMLVPERFRSKHPGHRDAFFKDPKARSLGRSEERRVGEEGRSRWAPDH